MAAKKKLEEEAMESAPAPDPQEMPDPVQPIQHVRIVNLTAKPQQYHLTNGRTVSCGPKFAGGDIHKSEPVLRKLLGPMLRKLVERGLIALEPIAGGE